jgi:hypothetical protein
MPLPRFELKYRINEATADIVRGYARPFIAPDPYADPVSVSYTIDSLYLDSDDLFTFWSAVNDSRRRYKLRVRTYDEPTSPAFFEIKRCIDGLIVKERGMVRRSAVEKILSGWLPDRSDMISADPEHYATIENFVRLMLQIQAKPKAFVRYNREAWIGRDDREVRLTIDRDVGVTPKTTPGFPITELDDPVRPFGNIAVLEFKFSGTMPWWFQDLARVAGLRLAPAAKYCDGILGHDANHFSPVDWPVADPARQPVPDEIFAAKHAEPSLATSGESTTSVASFFLEEIRRRVNATAPRNGATPHREELAGKRAA